MNLPIEKKLSLFLKNYLRTSGPEQRGLSQADFVKTANNYEPGRKLDTVTFNKVVNGKTKPGDEILRKIAQVILNRADALVEELWTFVDTHEFPADDEYELKVASGFTIYSTLLLSAMGIVNEAGKCRLPTGVKFAFSSDEDGRPVWIENLAEIAIFRHSLAQLTQVYIADDLERLYTSKEIDGFFMLRSSFEATRFVQMPAAERPVQVTRCATGYGTSLYVIGRELPPPPAPRPTALFALTEQILHLNKVFTERPVRLYYLNNATIQKTLNTYFSYPELQNAIRDYKQAPLLLTRPDYEMFLNRVLGSLQNPKAVLMLVAFEPLLNRVYHDVMRVLRESNAAESVSYQFFNLSHLANEPSTYCFYARPEALLNSDKLLKINELLSLLSTQPRLDYLNSVPLTNILFRADDVANDVSKFDRLNRVYKEIQIRNNSIPIVQLLSHQIF